MDKVIVWISLRRRWARHGPSNDLKFRQPPSPMRRSNDDRANEKQVLDSMDQEAVNCGVLGCEEDAEGCVAAGLGGSVGSMFPKEHVE